MRVPHFIKEAVLREYASHCKGLHAIAHFQWRNRYKGYNEEIEANFRSRVNKVFKGIHDLSKTLPSPETYEASRLPSDFMVRYGLEDYGNKYKINSFD